MNGVSIEPLELLTFFEAEPQSEEPEVPWYYGSHTYQTRVGDHHISFGLLPAHGDVSLTIRHQDRDLYHLVALSVRDIRYRRDGAVETLEIILSERDRVFLRLRPDVVITQDASGLG
ncbi:MULTISPECIES: hypothetical protein [unclassified Achromobacter]|uniref:hypothetical protein n=1 Tax=unclassified Achromobacter TaxID=2626865 RepID=UPI00069D9B7F|nr:MULTISPECIES: hypothetical protein [unclassified Achromobacter]